MNFIPSIDWLKNNPDADPGGHDGADLFDMPLPKELRAAANSGEWCHVGDGENGHWMIGDSGYGVNVPDAYFVCPDGIIIRR